MSSLFEGGGGQAMRQLFMWDSGDSGLALFGHQMSELLWDLEEAHGKEDSSNGPALG